MTLSSNYNNVARFCQNYFMDDFRNIPNSKEFIKYCHKYTLETPVILYDKKVQLIQSWPLRLISSLVLFV